MKETRNREELLILLQIERRKREEEYQKRLHLEKQLTYYLRIENIKRKDPPQKRITMEMCSNEEEDLLEV